MPICVRPVFSHALTYTLYLYFVCLDISDQFRLACLTDPHLCLRSTGYRALATPLATPPLTAVPVRTISLIPLIGAVAQATPTATPAAPITPVTNTMTANVLPYSVSTGSAFNSYDKLQGMTNYLFWRSNV